jgi:hypothetical protein
MQSEVEAMIERRSAEEWSAELEEIQRRYRLANGGAERGQRLTQAEAVARLRKLGFTLGEALRLLRPKFGR